MITVKLIGGLGNQMFQYAYGRRISLKKGEKLKLDLTFLLSRMPRKNFTFRDYELGIFNIDAQFTFLSKLAFKFNRYIFVLQLFFNKVNKFIKKCSVLDEVSDCGDLEARALNCKHSVYLSGLFDRIEYVADIEKILRRDFSFKKELFGKNKELASGMSVVNSTSLHIRRGDYVGNGTISESDYYQKAINYICQKVDDPIFYIFSDEPEWVRENLKLPVKYFVVDFNGGKDSYIDMQLMSLCKNNIIANSTFSWWGAWLNSNPDKIVIAPR